MRTAEHLSPRQQEILNYIQGFVDAHGYPPAIRQIQDSLKISSTSVVAYNLKALEAKGVLQREGKVSRGIKLPQTTPVTLSNQNPYQVPLLGVITAGQPLLLPQEAQETPTEFVEVSPEVAPPDRLKDVYALRVRGHSMIDALIDDGDIVLLRATNTAENGQMVAAFIEDENSVTLKRFYKEGSRVRLQPANVTMEPIYVNADQVRVQGRVVGVIRSMF
jgi:repressor LexA